MSETLDILDQTQPISISFEDMMKYHGPGYPGGVAHAFKVMQRALPLLDPGHLLERREIVVETAFRGPGARDAFEMVTRAVTADRYAVDPALERPERGATLERYVFRLRYRDRSVTLVIRDGYVTSEFIKLARKEERSAAEEQRLAVLKQEMADRLMAAAAPDVYDVDPAA
jgi:hypothetical protein